VAEGSSVWRGEPRPRLCVIEGEGGARCARDGHPGKIVDMARHPAFGSEREGVSIFLMHRSKIAHEPTNRFSPLPLS
jgi:hypothetical protein